MIKAFLFRYCSFSFDKILNLPSSSDFLIYQGVYSFVKWVKCYNLFFKLWMLIKKPCHGC